MRMLLSAVGDGQRRDEIVGDVGAQLALDADRYHHEHVHSYSPAGSNAHPHRHNHDHVLRIRQAAPTRTHIATITNTLPTIVAVVTMPSNSDVTDRCSPAT